MTTYHGTNCANATHVPCWVPQMKDMVELENQNNLEKCPTIMDYNCEKNVLWQSMVDAGFKCINKRPCENIQYKLNKKDEVQISKGNLDSASLKTFWKRERRKSFNYVTIFCSSTPGLC